MTVVLQTPRPQQTRLMATVSSPDGERGRRREREAGSKREGGRGLDGAKVEAVVLVNGQSLFGAEDTDDESRKMEDDEEEEEERKEQKGKKQQEASRCGSHPGETKPGARVQRGREREAGRYLPAGWLRRRPS